MRGRNLLQNKVVVAIICVLMALVGIVLLYKGFSAKKPATTPIVVIEQATPTAPSAIPTPLPRLHSMDALEGDSSQAIQPIEGIPQGVKVASRASKVPADEKQVKQSLPRRIVSFLVKILTSWPAIFVYVLLIIFWRGGLFRRLRKLRNSGPTGPYSRIGC